jgi:hypothetical protein
MAIFLLLGGDMEASEVALMDDHSPDITLMEVMIYKPAIL